MRVFLLLLLVSNAPAQLVDRTQPLPQSPRQTLIEILNSKDGSAIEKHLPEITKKKMRELGTGLPTGFMIPAGGFAANMRSPGDKMDVFEAGAILARFEDPRTSDKIEITIENEDFRGDEDDVELSFHMFKNGEETMHWYTPRILLHMKQEAGTWRFTEVGFSAKLPIGDPAFLDAMTKEMAASRRAAGDASAVASLRALATAEIQYGSSYPDVGFTCSLANLGSAGMQPGVKKQFPNELHAMLIDDILASGHRNGYSFQLANCDARPASHFTITASPESAASGRRTYCTDESGVIRYSPDGKAETCLNSGKALQ